MAKESGVQSEGNLLDCIEVREGKRTQDEGEEGAAMCEGVGHGERCNLVR